MSVTKLYTPEMLGLAVELAAFPLMADATATGEARSASCGSTLTVGLRLAEGGPIEAVGLQVRACAVGQAAAALFARDAVGRDAEAIVRAHDQLVQWLAGEASLPQWRDLALLEPARSYAGRHGAILLPWAAALSALSRTSSPA